MSEPRIAVLDQDVINQIAAGEVVERPASVVKELAENALDAGAGRVDVQVTGGGQRLIHVVDDGCGMTRAEARLSLMRHATSKLRRLDDLGRIRSMGFRGEALPSIASVSRLSLVTRAAGEDVGTRLELEGGRVLSEEPAGARPGTGIQVRDLFFNTPARHKFLKSTATEAAHISDAVTRLALAEPGVHFSLEQDGRRSLDLPRCDSRLERARSVLGRQGRRLVAARREQGRYRVEACLGPPDQTQRTARSVTLMVNRRHVRDRSLVHAVVAGYGELLDRGRFPVAVVYLELDPAALDVNVHPQKTEVRFEDPRGAFSAIRRCVNQALAASPWLEAGQPPAARSYALPATPASGDAGAATAAGYAEHKRRLVEASRRFWGGPFAGDAAGAHPVEYQPTGPGAGDQEPAGFFSALRVLGQVLGTYLVCEGQGELILIDQHAAHERVTFERLRRAAAERRVPSQRLLIPVSLELDPRRAAAARDRGGTLERLGFEVEDFGGDTWTVRAVPALLRAAAPEPLLRDTLEELCAGGEAEAVDQALDAVLARMACHGSVRAGDALEPAEIRALLSAMDRVDFSAACPHGRPVMLRLDRSELEQRFKRR
jgi:DNA mismatch repair protein MutL